MINLSFVIDGTEQLNRSLSRFGSNIRDIRGVFPKIKEAFFKSEKRQFDNEEGRGSWTILKESYAAWKERYFPGRKILVLSGLLEETMTQGSPYLRWREEPMQLSVEVDLEYAYYHQKGTSKMTKREIVYLNEEAKQDFTRELHGWLFARSKDAGLGGL